MELGRDRDSGSESDRDRDDVDDDESDSEEDSEEERDEGGDGDQRMSVDRQDDEREREEDRDRNERHAGECFKSTSVFDEFCLCISVFLFFGILFCIQYYAVGFGVFGVIGVLKRIVQFGKSTEGDTGCVFWEMWRRSAIHSGKLYRLLFVFLH